MSQIQVPGRGSGPAASDWSRGLADPGVTVLVDDRGDREAIEYAVVRAWSRVAREALVT